MKIKLDCTGGSPTCTDTSAPAIGLFWESKTFPEILTVSPGAYCDLSVESVIDKVPCERTSGTKVRMKSRTTRGRMLRGRDSRLTCVGEI